MTRRHPHVVNIEDGTWTIRKTPQRFEAISKSLGDATGGQKLGCSYYEVPPGKTSFPFHAHFANEEAIYILAGEATLRIGPDTVAVGPGDYIALPPRPDLPHQLIAGAERLRYLCISTKLEPEVVVYPDSKKVRAIAARGTPGEVDVIAREGESLAYFDGEDAGVDDP
jgi:uncharacterized cupin superfamily protein